MRWASLCLSIAVALGSASDTPAADPDPGATPRAGSRPARERISERTIRAAVEVSRDGARLVAFTLKPRPFTRGAEPAAARAYERGRPLQLELVLRGSGARRLTWRVATGPICLDHGPGAPAHIEGDTILLHRETFVVELPELAGMDRLELAYHERERGRAVRHPLGSARLDVTRFTSAGTPTRFSDLQITSGPAPPADAAGSDSGVLWPESFGDPDIYRIWGDPAEDDERITIVMVPDGYTYAEKALMETHAENMVQHFRGKTPYAEHDLFINYVLVYAYSAESGTDECDCGVYRDTAMGTRFPDAGQPCGHSANRCLYYGAGCDTNSSANIAAAELRAPSHDTTIVLVNTARYGGCGGYRAVYSAGNSQANEVAVHELGHSLAGLADEYGGSGSCGSYAGEINTSANPVDGAWPEWIGDLGPPVEGAQYYDNCLYRPTAGCEMRSLNQPFCPVCNQRWALTFFAHPRIAPSAPIRGSSPAPSAQTYTGVPTAFSVDTRLPGSGATHTLTWRIRGPGEPDWSVLAQGTASLVHTFDTTGRYELSCEVVADTNFVKPSRNGANVDSASWSVDVTELLPPEEVSPPGAQTPLRFTNATTLEWQELSAPLLEGYNLYRGPLGELALGNYGSCLSPAISGSSTQDTATPPTAAGFSYLVAASNPTGEGPLGQDGQGNPRSAQSVCP